MEKTHTCEVFRLSFDTFLGLNICGFFSLLTLAVLQPSYRVAQALLLQPAPPQRVEAILREQSVIELLAKSVHLLRQNFGESTSEEFLWLGGKQREFHFFVGAFYLAWNSYRML